MINVLPLAAIGVAGMLLLIMVPPWHIEYCCQHRRQGGTYCGEGEKGGTGSSRGSFISPTTLLKYLPGWTI